MNNKYIYEIKMINKLIDNGSLAYNQYTLHIQI